MRNLDRAWSATEQSTVNSASAAAADFVEEDYIWYARLHFEASRGLPQVVTLSQAATG
jgi:hypothetical protein